VSPSAALWISIVLGSCAQVFLKRGVTADLPASSGSYLRLLRSAWIWAWGLCFTVATGLWMIAVSKIALSYAFPLLSIGYLIVALLSMIFLKERVPALRWLAIAVVTLGVSLILGSS